MSGGFLKFSIYAIIFIFVLVYLFGSLSFQPPNWQGNPAEQIYVPYSTKKLGNVNITKSMLVDTLNSMRFERYGVSESPLILAESKNGADLKTMLLNLLSESAKNITPEQYSVVADLTGLYNLSRSDRVKNETVEYPILSPFNSFIVSFETFEPISISNISYPPSADFSISFAGSTIARLVASFQYRGHTVEEVESCEYDWLLMKEVCVVKDVVKVRFDETYRIGDLRKSIPHEVKFVFARGHKGCVSQDYSIKGFGSIYLTVRHCKVDDNTYSVRVEPETYSGSLYGNLKKYSVSLKGYHGENKLKLKSTCSYSICYNEKTEEYVSFTIDAGGEFSKQGQKWSASVQMPIFAALPKTFVWCSIEIEDTITVPLDNETFKLNRTYQAGRIWYYYMTGADGEIEERLRIYPETVPEWAKREFKYDPWKNQSAEDLMIILYAETARRALQENITKELDEIKNNSLWDRFFGTEDQEFARSLMEYFYLVQVPLDIEVNSSLNYSRLHSFLMRTGNETTISSLYTFSENTTYINTTKTTLNRPSSSKEKVDTYLILASVGESNFVSDGLNTSCGTFAVGELAYYRQPGFQYIPQDFISNISREIEAYKGYTSIPGVVFKKENKTCYIERR